MRNGRRAVDHRSTVSTMRKGRLSDEQALWAIGMASSGEMNQMQIAKELDVSHWLINKLITGRTYGHLHGTAGQRIGDRNGRYGMVEVPERRYFREAKFWARVDRSRGPLACWPWIDGKPDDYGRTPVGKGLVGSTAAHVVAYALATGLGPPDRSTVLRHLCDNKPCCNPSHLKPGTVSENLTDRWRAQREGYPVPRPVENPMPEPSGGWRIVVGDLDGLERVARIAEFHSRVDSSRGPEACWPWTATAKHSFGYGEMTFDGMKNVPTHRIAYVVAHNLGLNDIKGKTILDKCPDGDSRNNCNNPAHLKAARRQRISTTKRFTAPCRWVNGTTWEDDTRMR